MSVMKLPDVNFGTSSGWLFGGSLFGGSQAYAGTDSTVAGSANAYNLNLLNVVLDAGVTRWTTYGFPGLYLFKGVPPTQTELDTAEASDTVVSALTGALRYSDLLLYMHPSAVTPVKNTLQVSLTPSAAIAAGTATWFMLGYHRYSSFYGVMQTGTVGLVGSGADLEIADTNIVLGTTYKQPALNIVFPNSMSV